MSSATTMATSSDDRKKGNTWVILAMGAGLSYGLGNVSYGQNCSQLGFWGTGFTGPVTLIIVVAYRLYQACRLKKETGSFVDKSNSNFWRLKEPSTERATTTEQDGINSGLENDDYQTAASVTMTQESQPIYEFRWENLRQCAIYQALPSQVALVLVSFAFKFALLAEINQGTVPSLFTAGSFYTSIVFYFTFKEVISLSKIIGICFMVPCVVLISLDPKEGQVSDSGLTSSEMHRYNMYAILMAISAPILWTFKSYCARSAFNNKEYVPIDLSLDQLFFSGLLATIVFVIFALTHDYATHILVEGSIAGLLFTLGSFCTMSAIARGPGGPINSLICTQIIY